MNMGWFANNLSLNSYKQYKGVSILNIFKYICQIEHIHVDRLLRMEFTPWSRFLYMYVVVHLLYKDGQLLNECLYYRKAREKTLINKL